MIQRFLTIAAILSSLSGILPAAATTVTYDVSFSVAGFTPYVPAPVPVDPLVGSFTVSFDPAQEYLDTTAGVKLDSLNIALGSSLSFEYFPLGDVLYVGGLESATAGVASGTDDFFFDIFDLRSNNPLAGDAYYAQSSAPTYFSYDNTGARSVSVTEVSPVPLPATLPLLGASMAGLGAIRWRKRRCDGTMIGAA